MIQETNIMMDRRATLPLKIEDQHVWVVLEPPNTATIPRSM